MNRKGEVYQHSQLAGIISEIEYGYSFQYDEQFLKTGTAISFSLPLQKEPYKSNKLFPFFEGLLPEGWTLNIYLSVLKIDEDDKFGLLLATCQDCIGAVSIKEIK
ncbi:MAG TPA: HipA-like protein [Lentisphaeria bacterium]|nr:HipA-like protein [Lentisphaeria bacterium]